MNKKLFSLYNLKFNPFSPEIPADALWVSPALESFCWRIEQQVGEGGFALVIGDPGTGKSTALRLLVQRLSQLRDVTVGVLTRPQASLADFYRELGQLFQVPLSPHNRWASAKVLREKWHNHIETSLYRPVLIIDEAQEMCPAVFSELRLLASADLDSRSILTVILAGDQRLGAKLESPDLLPLASRIRSRLRAEALPPQELLGCVNHLLKAAGNPKLLSLPLLQTLCEHAAGNLRLLMSMANDLLSTASRQEREQLDEKLFFEVFAPDPKRPAKRNLV
jgi:general secretion pathway protein A